jgi:outer membrane receptor protein involved in Fe transport
MSHPNDTHVRGPHLLSMRLAALLLCPVMLGTATAQTTPSPPAPAAKRATPRLPTEDEVTSSAKASAGEPNGEAIVLSPFVVTAEEDTGYQATSTLAGTRLRSNLKDIAASISVVTKDLMHDANITDSTSLLVYTLGTEVGGYGGNFSGVADPTNTGSYSDALGQLVPANRVRGLTGADSAREYFGSGVPFDSYNVDRVEINRGANAILFGLGSPAGIINTSIIKADVRKNQGKVEAQYGSYGSYRALFDFNQVLLPQKLAVRVASVFDQAQYRIEDAYNKKRAGTVTVTYQPLKETTFRVTHEHGRSDSTKPQIRPPYDWFTWWWAAGKPVWDPTTGTGHLLGTPQAPFSTTGPTAIFTPSGTRNGSPGIFLTGNFGGWRGSEIGLFYQDPNSNKLGGVDIGGGSVMDGVEAFTSNSIPNPLAPSSLTSGGMVGFNAGSTFIKEVYQPNNPYQSLYTQEPQITNPAIFDFYHEQMGGPSQYEWGEWTNTNLSFDQTFFNRRAGISIAYQKERINSGYVAPSDYQLDLDINEKLPNGAPNPNFLRPVMANFGSKAVNSSDNESYRATAYYQLDLRKTGPRWLGRILGHHDLQGNYMSQDTANRSLSGYPYIDNYDYVTAAAIYGVPANANGNARIVSLVNYLGPSVANAATPADAHAQGLTVAQDPTGVQTINVLYHHNPGTTTVAGNPAWQAGNFGLITNGRYDLNNTVSGASVSELEVHSLSTAVQSYWFDDALVSTVGWRKDRVWSSSNTNAAFTALGTRDIRPEVFYPLLDRASEDSSTTWGVVGHLPNFIQRYLPAGTELSAFYNSSDNFRVAPVRYTLTGEALPSETGTTREYGLRLGTFGGKLDFKVAHYETVAANATVSSLGGALNQLAIMTGAVIDHNFLGDNQTNPAGIAQFQNWLASPNGQIYSNAFVYSLTPNTNVGGATPTATYGNYSAWSDAPKSLSAVSAVKSTGYEFEAIYNPLKNWRISANASRTEAVRTNIAPELHDFVFGANGLVPLVQNPDGTPTAAGALVGSPTSQVTTSLKNWVFSNIINNGLITTFAQEGAASSELRRWNWRLVTDYQFQKGWLNGFSVGGAVRWQDKGLIGYAGGTIVSGGNTLVVSDVTKPYYSPAESVYDMWFGYEHKLSHGINWRLQLNIKNVGVGNELIPLQADPDGKVVMWRIKEAQKWTLTNTFEF